MRHSYVLMATLEAATKKGREKMTGTKTHHGYPILARKASRANGDIIVAFQGDTNPHHPFVVWRQYDSGNTVSGDYCCDIHEAVDAFNHRV